MLNFYIDGKKVQVSPVNTRYGQAWATVYVNNRSSAHTIPAHFADFKTPAKFFTGGHQYHITHE